MQKKIIILLLLVIGVTFYANNLHACSNSHNTTIAIIFISTTTPEPKSDCCKANGMDFGHDCNKKCNHHNCDCTSFCLNSYDYKNEISLDTIFTYSVQRKYFAFILSLYNDVHIPVWHPPKIA